MAKYCYLVGGSSPSSESAQPVFYPVTARDEWFSRICCCLDRIDIFQSGSRTQMNWRKTRLTWTLAGPARNATHHSPSDTEPVHTVPVATGPAEKDSRPADIEFTDTDPFVSGPADSAPSSSAAPANSPPADSAPADTGLPNIDPADTGPAETEHSDSLPTDDCQFQVDTSPLYDDPPVNGPAETVTDRRLFHCHRQRPPRCYRRYQV
jgi:hypothetical protein